MDYKEREDLEREAQHFSRRDDALGRMCKGVLSLLQDLKRAEAEIERTVADSPNPSRVVALTQTCESSPSQWEGKLDDGRLLYIRYRWGYLRIIAGSEGDMYDWPELYGKQIRDDMHGSLEFDKLTELTAGVLDFSGCNPTWYNPRYIAD